MIPQDRRNEIAIAVRQLGSELRAIYAEDAEWEEGKHPRGQPGNAGQFGKGGGSSSSKKPVTSRQTIPVASPAKQRESAKGLVGFLKIVASIQESSHLPKGMTAPARFVLKHGRQFIADDLTYAGKRGKPQQCYANAGREALDNSGKTYVEGYVLVHGGPIEHAWLVDGEGKVQDPTIRDGRGIDGYFGVPIKTEYLREQILKSGHWGVFGHLGTHDPLTDDPRKVVKRGLGEGLPESLGPKSAGRDSASRLLEEYGENTTSEALIAKLPAEVGKAVRQAEHRLSESVPTDAPVSKGGFKNPSDGSYTEERQKLHDEIIAAIFSDEAVRRATPKKGEKPTFTMIGGRGGSGKSYFSQAGIVDEKHTLKLDNDEIKAMLPEYRGWNASMLHEEASDLFERADRLGRELGLNVAHDATMKTYESAARRLDAYKASGYASRGLYMFCPPQEAARRALGRFMQAPAKGAPEGTTGRYVAPSYVLSSTTNEASFDALRDDFDDWSIYRSYGHKGDTPEKMAEKE